MPPFYKTHCPHCQETHTYDLADIEQTGGIIAKGPTLFRRYESEREYRVTCPNTGQEFKIKVPTTKKAG